MLNSLFDFLFQLPSFQLPFSGPPATLRHLPFNPPPWIASSLSMTPKLGLRNRSPPSSFLSSLQILRSLHKGLHWQPSALAGIQIECVVQVSGFRAYHPLAPWIPSTRMINRVFNPGPPSLANHPYNPPFKKKMSPCTVADDAAAPSRARGDGHRLPPTSYRGWQLPSG